MRTLDEPGRNRKVMLPLARSLMKPLLDHTVWSQQLLNRKFGKQLQE